MQHSVASCASCRVATTTLGRVDCMEWLPPRGRVSGPPLAGCDVFAGCSGGRSLRECNASGELSFRLVKVSPRWFRSAATLMLQVREINQLAELSTLRETWS